MAAAILLFCFQGAGRAPKRSGDLVQRGRKNRALWGSVHQVRAGRAPKRSEDLVQRGRKNKALRGSVHQVRTGRAPKRSEDLVQRERKNKALWGFVHQVRADRAPKRSGDLVQRERKNKVLRGFVHQVRAGRALKRSGDLVQRERKNKGLRGFVHQPRAEKTGKGGPVTAQVGARLPAKPCASVTGRQILPWSAAGHRPCWRPFAGKTLCLRYGAPTFYPEARPVTGRVGAPLPAKPYASVTRRQHFALERSRAPPKLVPHCRQSLVPPLRGANILPWSAAGNRPSWRPIAGKTLYLRCEAPTFCPGAQPVTGRVGALLPAKPCASVTGRQHFTLRLGRQPAKLALVCPQSQ